MIRDRGGPTQSNKATANFAKYTEDLIKHEGIIDKDQRLFEGQLQKKLGRLESSSAVPIKTLFIHCDTAKDETGLCIYYYIENLILLLERMNAGCYLDNKFLDSSKVSALDNVTIIKFGADRGMQDLIMEVSLGNRENGNHGKYAIPIGVVERAAETYSNLKNTFFAY